VTAFLDAVLAQASIGRLVPSLVGMGPRGLAWWQWLALPIFAAGALAVGRVLAALTRGLLHRIYRRTAATWDERWLARVAPGLTWLWAAIVFKIAMPWLEPHPAGERTVESLLGALVVVATFWMLWRSVDVLIEVAVERRWAAEDASARSMLFVGGNLLKAAVMALGVVSTLAAFGYPVTTIVAGLGIGGIAFAFGAQKTVENLFGSIALATDQPLRVGDVVKVDDTVGQVEQIGARSTRIRTPDRTVITIPNGRLADSRIESYAVRDRLRLATTIGLAYGTSEAQLRRVIAGIDGVLRAHPLVWPEVVVARLVSLGASSVDVEILCWFTTTDFEVFRDARQEVLLAIVKLVEDAGAAFAMPIAPPPPSRPPL
jgi:MscS family membrane protein